MELSATFCSKKSSWTLGLQNKHPNKTSAGQLLRDCWWPRITWGGWPGSPHVILHFAFEDIDRHALASAWLAENLCNALVCWTYSSGRARKATKRTRGKLSEITNLSENIVSTACTYFSLLCMRVDVYFVGSPYRSRQEVPADTQSLFGEFPLELLANKV